MFAVPWKPEFKENSCELTVFPVDDNAPGLAPIAKAAEALLAHRTDLLKNLGRYGIEARGSWGPTSLYNLYDDEEVELAGIERLRELHAELFQAVLRAYGWNDLATESGRADWIFDRPWIDRTPRFVPSEPTRRAVYERMGALNALAYKGELDMFVKRILEVLPLAVDKPKGMSVNQVVKALAEHYCGGDEKGIDKDVIAAALEHGIAKSRARRKIVRVGKSYAVREGVGV